MIEIGQNTAALEADSRQAVLDNSLQTLYTAVNEPEIWLSFVKPNLTEAERVRLSAYLFSMTQRGTIGWQQYQTGAADEASWLAFEGPLTSTLTYPQPRKWWGHMASIASFEPTFQERVNGLLEDMPIETQLPDIQAFD